MGFFVYITTIISELLQSIEIERRYKPSKLMKCGFGFYCEGECVTRMGAVENEYSYVLFREKL